MLFPRGPYEPKGCIGQHLYLTFDEPIKEGEWGIFQAFGDAKVKKAFTDSKSGLYRKIIATTNKELWENPRSSVYRGYKAGEKIVQKISNDLIEYFIKRYNEGNPIKQVWLETSIDRYWEHQEEFSWKKEITELKLNPSGEVIWKVEEERMYTKEEMEDAFEAGYNNSNKHWRFGNMRKEWFSKMYPTK